MLNKIFWSIVVLEALAFVALFIGTLGPRENSGGNDGGREMSLIFGVVAPMLVLGILALIYWMTSSQVVHAILLAIVVAPILFMANVWIIRPWQDQRTADSGSWLYNDPALQQFLDAISKHDANRVRQLAGQIDINAVAPLGGDGFTPLVFTVKKGEPALDMVRLLLSLGAKPNPALAASCEVGSAELTRVLLAAGADPNLQLGENEYQRPVVFECVTRPGSLPSLKVLVDKGARVEVLSANGRLPIREAAFYRCWDTVLFLHEHGAAWEASGASGMPVVQSIALARERGDQSEGLERVAALLQNQ